MTPIQSKRTKVPLDDEYSTSNSVGFLVRMTHKSFNRVLEKRLKEHKITVSMWFFLRLLWEKDGLSQKQCSYELNLSQPTIVSAIDNLEKRGLIRRVRNTEDRRLTNIFLTDAGWDLRKNIVHYAVDVNQVATESLTEAEINTVSALLTRINVALEAEYEG